MNAAPAYPGRAQAIALAAVVMAWGMSLTATHAGSGLSACFNPPEQYLNPKPGPEASP